MKGRVYEGAQVLAQFPAHVLRRCQKNAQVLAQVLCAGAQVLCAGAQDPPPTQVQKYLSGEYLSGAESGQIEKFFL